MNFFRLHFINTVLLLFIGIVLGYLMKERSGPRGGAVYTTKYPAAQAATEILPAEIDEHPPDAREVLAPEKEPRETAGERSEQGNEDYDLPIKSEPDETAAANKADPPPSPAIKYAAPDKEKQDDVVRGSDDAFFRNPGRFAGRDLEMNMQMIMARKTTRGWLLNLVRSQGEKNADYLYLEDDSVLDDAPDLKIGYSYIVRFRCQRGDAATGNKLLELTPTNDKASWATGISAVE